MLYTCTFNLLQCRQVLYCYSCLLTFMKFYLIWELSVSNYLHIFTIIDGFIGQRSVNVDGTLKREKKSVFFLVHARLKICITQHWTLEGCRGLTRPFLFENLKFSNVILIKKKGNNVLARSFLWGTSTGTLPFQSVGIGPWIPVYKLC